MKRTSLFLPSDLLLQAKRQARQEGKSLAQVVREALVVYMASPAEAHAGGLPPIAGQFGSGRGDTTSRVDELLWADPHR